MREESGMRNLCRALCASVLLLCGLYANAALAAPDEIQVYTDEMNAPGEFGLEQHINYTLSGTQLPDYPGQLPSQRLLQLTPEFSYGLSSSLEAGLYLPLALAADGNSYLNGLRLRLKYVAPRVGSEGWFYGANVEAGRSHLRISESASGMELRPLLGYRAPDWLLSFNPILNAALEGVDQQPRFEPALKSSYRVWAGVHAGLECYGEYGALNALLPASQRAHTLYGVIDVATPRFDVNFGIGHGLANAADAWVLKAIVALPLK